MTSAEGAGTRQGRVPAPSSTNPRYTGLFATHAAIALIGAQNEARLHLAVENRGVIGMAKGILMQRHDIDDLQASQLLVESSQTTNLKLQLVAEWVVQHRREL